MNTFVKAIEVDQNKGKTFNNAETNVSSGSACVDFFSVAGTRNADFSNMFELAFQENPELAMRTMLWLRDVRKGAGERETFRNLLKYMENKHPKELGYILHRIPEMGRWDDLLVFESDSFQAMAGTIIHDALTEGDALCAKWMPRRGPVAIRLSQMMGYGATVMTNTVNLQSVDEYLKYCKKRKKTISEMVIKTIEKTGSYEIETSGLVPGKGYRKLLANVTKAVESQMCAKEWNSINYDHVPSVAAARYQKAFRRHDPDGYQAYKDGLKTGERKVNTGAVYPYDILKSTSNGDIDVAQAQWDALPDYLGDNAILPMVDTSASMGMWNYYGQRDYPIPRSGVTPLDIAVSLGLYCASKQKGDFNGTLLTFSRNPDVVKVSGSLENMVQELARKKGNWMMNTDIGKAFDKVLTLAVQNNVPAEDMPKMLVIFSDMEFDSTYRYAEEGDRNVIGASVKAYDYARGEFERHGYELPTVVFWNLNGRQGNVPVTQHETGTMLVSGANVHVIKSILSAKTVTPKDVMLETIMDDRYAIPELAA